MGSCRPSLGCLLFFFPVAKAKGFLAEHEAKLSKCPTTSHNGFKRGTRQHRYLLKYIKIHLNKNISKYIILNWANYGKLKLRFPLWSVTAVYGTQFCPWWHPWRSELPPFGGNLSASCHSLPGAKCAKERLTQGHKKGEIWLNLRWNLVKYNCCFPKLKCPTMLQANNTPSHDISWLAALPWAS